MFRVLGVRRTQVHPAALFIRCVWQRHPFSKGASDAGTWKYRQEHVSIFHQLPQVVVFGRVQYAHLPCGIVVRAHPALPHVIVMLVFHEHTRYTCFVRVLASVGEHVVQKGSAHLACATKDGVTGHTCAETDGGGTHRCGRLVCVFGCLLHVLFANMQRMYNAERLCLGSILFRKLFFPDAPVKLLCVFSTVKKNAKNS